MSGANTSPPLRPQMGLLWLTPRGYSSPYNPHLFTKFMVELGEICLKSIGSRLVKPNVSNLSLSKLEHEHNMCSAVSSSTQQNRQSVCWFRPILPRWYLRRQCPVSSPVRTRGLPLLHSRICLVIFFDDIGRNDFE